MIEMHKIPIIDLRETNPLGEPFVILTNKKPKQKIDYSRIAKISIYVTFAGFLLVLAIVIIALFGPLVGIIILLLFVDRARTGR